MLCVIGMCYILCRLHHFLQGGGLDTVYILSYAMFCIGQTIMWENNQIICSLSASYGQDTPLTITKLNLSPIVPALFVPLLCSIVFYCDMDCALCHVLNPACLCSHSLINARVCVCELTSVYRIIHVDDCTLKICIMNPLGIHGRNNFFYFFSGQVFG